MQVEILVKRMICIFCSIIFVLAAAGCSDDEDTSSKKKVTQQIIIEREPEGSEENNSQDNYKNSDKEEVSVEENDTEESPSNSERRPLYEAEKEEVSGYEPSYTVKAVNWNGPEDYVIVYADGNRNTKAVADIVQKYFKSKTGNELKIVSDKTAASEKEILIGDTNRYKSSLNINEYAVSLKNGKPVFEGGHFAMVENAADWFASLSYQNGKLNTLTGKTSDFVSEINGYQYVWGDDFDGNALDMTKWCFADRMTGTGLMPTLTDENVVNVNEGLLKLTAGRYYSQSNPTAQYATNSSVCTQDTMSYKYGYLEVRARVPYQRGAWPSFWLLSNGALNNPLSSRIYNIEVDVFEVFSSTSTAIPNIHKWRLDTESGNYHTQYNGNHALGRTSSVYEFSETENLSNEYHIYGFDWTPEKMVMSIDGVDYMTYDLTYDFDQRDGMGDFDAPLFPIFNNFIYVSDLAETTAQNSVNNKDLPFEYFIDYIRLYQKPGVGELNLPE